MTQKSLYLLRQEQLEACYREASEELTEDFDITASDDLDEDETW